MILCETCKQDARFGGQCDLPEDYREFKYRGTGNCSLYIKLNLEDMVKGAAKARGVVK